MGLSGGAWDTLRRKVLARDMGICFLCDRFGADQVDHLVEVADGGSNDLTNLASCHESCPRTQAPRPGVGAGTCQAGAGGPGAVGGG